jgi:hypothetical protein
MDTAYGRILGTMGGTPIFIERNRWKVAKTNVRENSMGAWREEALDSLKFHPARHALPFYALRAGHRAGGLRPYLTPLDIPSRTPLENTRNSAAFRISGWNYKDFWMKSA